MLKNSSTTTELGPWPCAPARRQQAPVQAQAGVLELAFSAAPS